MVAGGRTPDGNVDRVPEAGVAALQSGGGARWPMAVGTREGVRLRERVDDDVSHMDQVHGPLWPHAHGPFPFLLFIFKNIFVLLYSVYTFHTFLQLPPGHCNVKCINGVGQIKSSVSFANAQHA
jgi:hypothetical protein